ncbi:putative response regulator, CheY [Deinococcus deserti VCD115]|uniref:Putative response regulator, CheY n=2 Tax=Deinococcus TaxID=1298 RepID=C1D1I2_DEIDV|nr:putative response regulator, CheY [Deinococcus deserti VCD115]
MPYTILVVDDEPAILTMLEVILSADGHRIVTANDGRAALEYLRDNTPDAMLLDIKLPHMDGFEICSRVKRISRLKNTPVLLLTAFDDDHTRDHARMVGADDVVYKPLSGKNLRGRITQLIAARRY